MLKKTVLLILAQMAMITYSNATPLNTASSEYIGLITDGIPAAAHFEAEYINILLTLGPGLVISAGGETYDRAGSFLDTTSLSVATATGFARVEGGITADVTGFEYLLGKYGSSAPFSLVWYVGDLSGDVTLPISFLSHITLFNAANSVNEPPTAEAGSDLSIRAGDLVQLDGSASSDDNTASVDLLYDWSFASVPAGSTEDLVGADTATPSFLADVPGSYMVGLVVTDEGGLSSDPDFVIVGSDNIAPTAVAASDFEIYIVGDTVNLDGTGSSDLENDPLTYDWSLDSQPAGSGTAISDTASAAPTLFLDIEGTYDVSLTVSDFIGPGTPDSLSVVATTAEEYAEIQIIEASDIVLDLSPGEVTNGGNQTALGLFFQQAIVAINDGDIAGAIDKLKKARDRTDGCILRGSPDTLGSSRDWITDCAVQAELYALLTDAIDSLNLLLPSG